jgi:mandelate racemase
MISTTRLTVSGLRARAVDVPVQPPLETASATLGSAPLVLVDRLTEEGVTGRSYAFCYTPLALGPMARLVSNLGAPARSDSLRQGPEPLHREGVWVRTPVTSA